MATDTGLHLIYTWICLQLWKGTRLYVESFPRLRQMYHWDVLNCDFLAALQDESGDILTIEVNFIELEHGAQCVYLLQCHNVYLFGHINQGYQLEKKIKTLSHKEKQAIMWY